MFKKFILLVLFALLAFSNATAQEKDQENVKVFDNGTIIFEMPESWYVVDGNGFSFIYSHVSIPRTAQNGPDYLKDGEIVIFLITDFRVIEDKPKGVDFENPEEMLEYYRKEAESVDYEMTDEIETDVFLHIQGVKGGHQQMAAVYQNEDGDVFLALVLTKADKMEEHTETLENLFLSLKRVKPEDSDGLQND